MATVSVVKICGVFLGVAGCTIRPLPVGVGDPTTAIIKKIAARYKVPFLIR